MTPAKRLKHVALSGSPNVLPELLMDVNIAGEKRDGFAWA
jgi:hypothetical protein